MADDVQAVVDRLDARPVVIAGHGGSAPFGVALAAARPKLTARVVVFAGTLPRLHLDDALGAQFADGYAVLEADLLFTTSDCSDHVRRCAAPAILLHGARGPRHDHRNRPEFRAGA